MTTNIPSAVAGRNSDGTIRRTFFDQRVDMLAAALRYARKGARIFPVWGIVCGRCDCGSPTCSANAGKHPITVNGVHAATYDLRQVEEWWTRHPNANIGLALADTAVIDVDPRHGGDTTYRAIESERGALPATLRSLTGGGGWHDFYQAPRARELPGKLGRGIELKRGEGHYVVMPPSLHISGRRYEWAPGHEPGVTPLASLPSWIAKAAKPPPSPAPVARGPLAHIAAADRLRGIIRFMACAREGERNNVTYWGTQRLVDMVQESLLSQDEALAIAVEAAGRTGLDRKEILQTVHSVFKNRFGGRND